jgi:hypothetical protein
MAEGKLREVEEDAEYIAKKRFAEHYEEQAREAEKRAREEAKNNPTDENSEDKKGK